MMYLYNGFFRKSVRIAGIFFIMLFYCMPFGCSIIKPSQGHKAEKKEAAAQKKVMVQYKKAQKQHYKNQSKEARKMMKQTQKHAKAINKPKERHGLWKTKCN